MDFNICSLQPTTPSECKRIIPMKSILVLPTSHIQLDSLSVRHSLILVGIGDLLLFQQEYGKISGIIWITLKATSYMRSCLLMHAASSHLLMPTSHMWSLRQTMTVLQNPITSLSPSASSFQSQEALMSLWIHTSLTQLSLILTLSRSILSIILYSEFQWHLVFTLSQLNCLQSFSVQSMTEDFSDCYKLKSNPLAAAVVESELLWWPAGVKWPSLPLNLVKTTTTVTIRNKNVSE